MSVKEQIEEIVKSDNVVLFMKGNRSMPQCGFSATVIGILNEVVPKYTTFNVLSDPDVRQGIKEFSDWPTIPQLYVNGEFMGGCDIIREMYGNGELYTAVGVEPPKVVTPSLTITTAAAAHLKEAMTQAPAEAILRLSIDERYRHDLFFGDKGAFDAVATSGEITVHIDPQSAKRAEGLVIDFVEGDTAGTGFKIDNPNGPTEVKQMSVQALKSKLETEEKLRLFDVRTPEERETARIEQAEHLTADMQTEIDGLPRDTLLVFHCHHGSRSQQTATQFAAQGFTNVHNLQGGIDAWSQHVDPAVQRY